jgi:hypothetical protein
MRRKQRGDTDLFCFLLLCFVLFWGDPDLWDAIQKWSHMVMQAK